MRLTISQKGVPGEFRPFIYDRRRLDTASLH